MIKRVILFAGVLIIPLLIIFSISATSYLIQSDDYEYPLLEDVGDLEWRIWFMTYGGEKDSNNPSLFINGNPIIEIPYSRDESAIWEWTDHYRVVDWIGGLPAEQQIAAGVGEYYVFEHSSGLSQYTERQKVSTGSYDFSLVSYGDGFNPEQVENFPFPCWFGNGCGVPVTEQWDQDAGPGVSCLPINFGQYYESQDSICAESIGSNKCPICYDNPNNCIETTSDDAYFCNGVYAAIVFYDAEGLEGHQTILTILSDNWGNITNGDISYFKDGITWWTDSDPETINIEQKIIITCVDECSLGNLGCNGESQEWDCVMGEEGCYIKNYTTCSNDQICVVDSCVSLLSEVNWKDMNNNYINNAGVGDLVKLVVSGDLAEENISYEIKKVDGGLLWFDKTIMSQDSTEGFLKWRAGKNNDGEFEQGEYYFRVAFEGTSDWRSTEDNSEGFQYLIVGPEANSLPVANITGPEDRQMYFINTELTFNQSSFDEDSEFDYTWDLGDEIILSGDSITKENWAFPHTYTTAGQKNIVLIVNDGLGIGRDMISILILDAPNANNQTLAYIDSPKWGQSLKRTITFNGSGSYAAEYGGSEVNCLSGNCPSETKNGPGGTAELEVKDIPSPINYNYLTFNWLITNGFTEIESEESSDHDPILTHSFDTPSVPHKAHKAKLTVVYSA